MKKPYKIIDEGNMETGHASYFGKNI